GVVGERVEPRLHPALDVVEQPPSRQTPAGGEQTPGDEITGGSGGGVEQGGEGQEEEERRAEVALVDEDQEAPRPHRDQRDELAGLGDADRAELAVGAGEGGLTVGQVGGEESDEEDLGYLGGLEMQLGEAEVEHHPQAAASLGQAPDGQRAGRREVGQEE